MGLELESGGQCTSGWREGEWSESSAGQEPLLFPSPFLGSYLLPPFIALGLQAGERGIPLQTPLPKAVHFT